MYEKSNFNSNIVLYNSFIYFVCVNAAGVDVVSEICQYGPCYGSGCGRYVDSNENGQCDNSEALPTSSEPIKSEEAVSTDNIVVTSEGVTTSSTDETTLTSSLVIETSKKVATTPDLKTENTKAPDSKIPTSDNGNKEVETTNKLAETCSNGPCFGKGCGRYTDENSNGQCDRSEKKLDDTGNTDVVAKETNNDPAEVYENDKISNPLAGTCSFGPCKGSG